MEFGQEVYVGIVRDWDGAHVIAAKRATIRCGRCGVPMGSDLSDGHICDDRLDGYDITD